MIQPLPDVLTLSRNHVSERRGHLWVALRQKKTGELLDVPVHARTGTVSAGEPTGETALAARAQAPGAKGAAVILAAYRVRG